MWTDAFAADQLAVGAARAWRHGSDQVAIFRIASDEFHAVANRCPHEGYALVQGYVAKGTLTCAWHNFKFDLKTGDCLLGDEAVRVYPVRCEDGRIQVDLQPLDPEVLRARSRDSLRDAVLDRRIGQGLRDLVRLQQLGMNSAELASELLLIDADHARYGTTHGTPTTLEGLAQARNLSGRQAIRYLIPGLTMVSDGVARLPKRARAEASDQPSAPRMIEAIEAEDLPAAEAELRGLIATERHDELLGALRHAVTRHFLSFGHRLIYQVALEQFLASQGWKHAERILGAHLAGIIGGTRHNTLPPWQRWMTRIETLPRQSANADREGFDPRPLADALILGSEDAAFAALEEALQNGVSTQQLAQGLLLAACETMRRFRIELDADPTCQDDWLNITHVLTTCVAGFEFTRLAEPEASLRMVVLGARFIHGMQPLLGEAHHYEAPEDLQSLVEACFDDPSSRPIVTAHYIKTTTALLRAHAYLPEAEKTVALDGLMHLHTHPPRSFNSARLLNDAWVNVVEDKVPKNWMR